MYYYDHKGQLCFDDGVDDYFVESDGQLTKADWFWYL